MKKIRTVIIGGGFIGSAHIEALKRLGNVEVVAICDEVDAKKKANAFQVSLGYEDYKLAIDELKPDVIHICTPNHTHYAIAEYAIERQVNVVCEKPFTTTCEQAEKLIELAKVNQVRGIVNFHNRFYPMPSQMHHMVKRGEIGDVLTIHGSYVQDWLLYDYDYSWRLDSLQAGKTRAVADIGSHWMDLAEFVTGLKIEKVNALFSTVYPVRKKPIGNVDTFKKSDENRDYETVKIDTEDAAVILMQFGNGVIGTLIVSQVFAGKKNSMQLQVAGKQNSLIWDSENLSELYIGYRDKANEYLTKDASLLCKRAAGLVSYPSGHMEGFPDALKHAFSQFYQSLEGKVDYFYAGFEDGLREMKLCDAIYKSAKTGEWQSI